MTTHKWPRAVAAITVVSLILLALVGARWFQRKMSGKFTVADRLTQFGPAARERWAPFFQKAGVQYPPAKLQFAAFKQERVLQVFASDGSQWRFIRAFPILAASGVAGPKLREGDRQVPEGIYSIESLNPNSKYHLALRINYPNAEDESIAAAEGRENLGGDIMIHGSNVSIGCLAMGDEAAEDLFVLAAERWPQDIPVILFPADIQKMPITRTDVKPDWLAKRYSALGKQLAELRTPSLAP